MAGLRGGEVDAVPALATPLPSLVLAELLGLDVAACGRLRALAFSITETWLPAAALRDLGVGDGIAATLRRDLCPFAGDGSPIQRLATGHPDDDEVDLAGFLLLAGAESIAATVSAACDLLARDPALQERVRSDPASVPGFVRETLRLAGPLRSLNRRVALTDVTIGGVALHAGDLVRLRTDCAHRDPQAYPDPERVDPSRRDSARLAFGGGAHRCQGPRLGTAEVDAMVRALLERFRLRPGSSRGRLMHREDWRVFETLPIVLEPLDGAVGSPGAG